MNQEFIQKELHKIFLKKTSNANLFDIFISECEKWYSEPVHSFSEMRRRENKKLRGDIFEEFCVLYLKYVKNYSNVYLLKDTPLELLKKLELNSYDMGIDIIIENNNQYYAVQCKYRKHVTIKKNVIGWKTLSTFYGMCLRTGPWDKYIIMTNCDYTRHQGKKTSKDVSICIGTFRNISNDEWLQMSGINGIKLGDKINEDVNDKIEPIKNKISKEELRILRLQKFET